MDKKTYSFFFTIIIVLLNSCTKVIDVTIPADEEKLVVEGLVTNRNAGFTVKLTKTLPLNEGEVYPVVDNATVTISDNFGYSYPLDFDPILGQYSTSYPHEGIVGRTYFLKIEVDGKTYTAQDKLLPPPILDSLYFLYLESGSTLNVSFDGYYVFYDFKDPAEETNYYRYDIWMNYYLLDLKQLSVFDDRFLAPSVKGSMLPNLFLPGDFVNFQFFSLSKPAYDYYRGLSLQLQNDGGFFSTPPANAPTNISGGALGFFLVSSIASDTLTIPQ